MMVVVMMVVSTVMVMMVVMMIGEPGFAARRRAGLLGIVRL
jgi:hypothetical protein